MRTRVAVILLGLLAIMNAGGAALLQTLQELQAQYGPIVETNHYRPDLYPTSYSFQTDGAKVQVELFGGRAANVTVTYRTKPPDVKIPDLLKRFSAVDQWTKKSTSETDFAKHFPAFNPKDARNEFYAAEDRSAFCLVQSNIAPGELQLLLLTKDYWVHVSEYRKTYENAPNKTDAPNRR